MSVINLLYFVNNSLESFLIVNSEVSEHLTVNLDTGLVQTTHELRVAHAFEASSSIDTLNPKRAEIALLVATIAESVGETLLPSILGYGPHILAGTIVTAGQLKNTLALGARCYMIY